MNFAEIRQAAPSIHVFEPTFEPDSVGVTVLTPQDHDARYEDRRPSKDCTKGDGSRGNPYKYKGANPVSPHYGIVDLWFRFRNQFAFIQVNDWLLQVGPEGVIAADGHFTRLLA